MKLRTRITAGIAGALLVLGVGAVAAPAANAAIYGAYVCNVSSSVRSLPYTKANTWSQGKLWPGTCTTNVYMLNLPAQSTWYVNGTRYSFGTYGGTLYYRNGGTVNALATR